VHLAHRLVEQADVEVDESQLMVCLVGIRIEGQRAPVGGNRALVRELIPRLPEEKALSKVSGVEIRIDGERALDLDERPLLQRQVAASFVEQPL
jgi:hypothetical protein